MATPFPCLYRREAMHNNAGFVHFVEESLSASAKIFREVQICNKIFLSACMEEKEKKKKKRKKTGPCHPQFPLSCFAL